MPFKKNMSLKYKKLYIALILNFFLNALYAHAQEEDVSVLLSKVKTIKSIHYSVTTHSNLEGIPDMKTEIWLKEGYRRQDDHISNSTFKEIISIRTPDAEYKFYPEDKEYVVTKNAGFSGPVDILAEFPTQEVLSEKSFQVLGEEAVDGKKTTVITVLLKMPQSEVNEKIWIWKENGLPLKAESTLKADQLDLTDNQTIQTYEYFGFDEIPDNIFDITDMLQNYKEVPYKTTGTTSSPGVAIEIPASEAEEFQPKQPMLPIKNDIERTETIFNNDESFMERKYYANGKIKSEVVYEKNEPPLENKIVSEKTYDENGDLISEKAY